MRKRSPSPLRHVVTSLKVLAVATVLGTVVLAAERHMAAQVSPEEVITSDMALPPPEWATEKPAAGSKASPPPSPAPAGALNVGTSFSSNPTTPEVYFPSQLPGPSSETAEQPSSF